MEGDISRGEGERRRDALPPRACQADEDAAAALLCWLTVILVVFVCEPPSLTDSIIVLSRVSLSLSVMFPRCAICMIISVTADALSGFTRAMRATAEMAYTADAAGEGRAL